MFRGWIVVHIPCTPVQCGFDRNDLVVIAIAHQTCVIHFGWIDDALGREQVQRIEMLFDLFEGIVDTWTKLPFNPFTAAQTITVFTAVGAFEFTH